MGQCLTASLTWEWRGMLDFPHSHQLEALQHSRMTCTLNRFLALGFRLEQPIFPNPGSVNWYRTCTTKDRTLTCPKNSTFFARKPRFSRYMFLDFFRRRSLRKKCLLDPYRLVHQVIIKSRWLEQTLNVSLDRRSRATKK